MSRCFTNGCLWCVLVNASDRELESSLWPSWARGRNLSGFRARSIKSQKGFKQQLSFFFIKEVISWAIEFAWVWREQLASWRSGTKEASEGPLQTLDSVLKHEWTRKGLFFQSSLSLLYFFYYLSKSGC